MTDFLQLLLSGVATGAIYAMAALGFTLLWQAAGTINFAQGEFVMLPAFAMLIGMSTGLPLWGSFIVAVALSILVLGAAFKRWIVDPMPFSLDNAKPSAVIADCGMKTENTELLRVAAERGHRVQKGKEMLFEQAPLYMARFGWPGVTADEFRALGVL